MKPALEEEGAVLCCRVPHFRGCRILDLKDLQICKLVKYFNMHLLSPIHPPTGVSGWGNKGTPDAVSVTLEVRVHGGGLAYSGAHTPLTTLDMFFHGLYSTFHIPSPKCLQC